MKGIVSGEIDACKWVRQSCQRQLNDLKKFSKKSSKYYFDEGSAERVCKFIELLPHVTGDWAKRKEKIKLEGWQCFLYTTVFGWKIKETGNRRYRTVYIEVPRKNSKSTMAAGVALYMLTEEGEPGAEIYSAATTRDQARIVFEKYAKQMARREPGFRKKYGVQINARSLNVLETGSIFEPLSADAHSLEGLNIHCAIIDELHAHKTREVYDVVETGTGSRSQPLIWIITTAGSNRAGICYEQRTYTTKILNNVIEDDTYFGIVYTIDKDDDWKDPQIWKKANPNYGISVYPDEFARLAAKAMQMSSAQNNFLTKKLNIWVNADSAWMNMVAWEKCSNPDLCIEDFKGQRCWVGLDLASKLDIAAMSILFEKDDHVYSFNRYYLPEETVDNAANSQYSGWARDGRLIVTPGAIIDFSYIEDDLRELTHSYEIAEVPYDPYQATQFATRMVEEGFPMLEVQPNVLNFSEPMKQIEALAVAQKFHFDGDPILTWMVSNVVCHFDRKDNIYPRKERQENKIDGVVSNIMAMGSLLANRDEESIYGTRGLISIGADDEIEEDEEDFDSDL